jgi:hypothetical protein
MLYELLQALTFVVLLRFFINQLLLRRSLSIYIVLAYLATTQNVLEEGQVKRRVYDVCILQLPYSRSKS